MSECNAGCECRLVAVKRGWVPEWLWSRFKWVIPLQPFKWIFTTPVNEESHD